MFQAEDGIRDYKVTGVQTCALPIYDNGILEQTELDKHKKAKNMLIDKLLNPTTQQEKKISVDE